MNRFRPEGQKMCAVYANGVGNTCGCCHRRGNGGHCLGCVISLCRRCSFCLTHCRCGGPRCVDDAIDEVMERVLASWTADGGSAAATCLPARLEN